MGGLPAPAGPHVLARKQPAAAQTEAISWGPPPCSSICKGIPLYGWKNTGIFAVRATGRRDLRVCRHGGQLLAHRPLCPSAKEAEARLLRYADVMWGQGTAWVLPRRERAPGPRESPREYPHPWPPWLQWPPPGSSHGAWSRSAEPRFAAGECLLRIPRTGGSRCLHGEGCSAIGDRGRRGPSPLSRRLPRL